MSLGYLCKNDVIRLTEEKEGGEFVQLKFHWNKMEFFLFILQKPRYFLLITKVFCYLIPPLSLKSHLSLRLMLLRMKYIMLHPSYRETRHPRRPRDSQSGREKRRDKSFQARAEETLGTDPYQTIFKRSSWLGTKMFVLLCPIAKQHLPRSFRVFVHDCYCLAILVWLVHQRNTRSQETFSLI